MLCQEIGHTFGLGHTSEDGTSQANCMDYSRSSDADVTADLATTAAGSSVTPNAHDFEQLTGIYTHTDSTTTVGATSDTAARLQPSDDKASWGGRSRTVRRVHGQCSFVTATTGSAWSPTSPGRTRNGRSGRTPPLRPRALEGELQPAGHDRP